MYKRKTTVPTQLTPHRMYVKAIWGLSNRLRTFRKAYCVCRRTGRELVIVDGNMDVGGCDTHIERLVTFPGVQFVQESPTADVDTIHYNVECSFNGNVPDGTVFFDGICDSYFLIQTSIEHLNLWCNNKTEESIHKIFDNSHLFPI